MPFTGKDRAIVTPRPLKNVLTPYSLYFIRAASFALVNFLFYRFSD
jgi:hypothetical protein